MFFFVILALLPCTEAQGPEHVFVLRGKDLHLDVKKSVKLTKKRDLFWKFNGIYGVAKINYYNDPVIFDPYDGRAEFVQNYSLLLKNMQHSDSGIYTVVVSEKQDQTVAEYRVTVQDAVSVPELTVIPVSSSSDSCNLTVTCSTEDLNIIFTCNAQNCYQVEEKSLKVTTSNSSLIVYLQQDFIFCNHSNQVSWKQNKEVKPHCETKSGSLMVSICLVKTVMFSVGLIIMVVAVISVHLMEKLKKKK